MTTPTADVTALLAAAALHPDDDTPRLMLADAAQEAGDDDRAELIRVQCELNRRGATDARPAGGEECYQCYCRRNRLRTTNGPCRCSSQVRQLRARERDLLAKHPEWLPTCPRCATESGMACGLCGNAGRVGALERGLLGRVRVPALGTVMVEDSCPHIVGGKCQCNNTGVVWRPTPWASAVFTDPWNRCARVECGDRVPLEVFPRVWCWSRWLPGTDEPHRIPDPTFDLMTSAERIDFATPADATLALSVALGAWLRKNVKLAAAAREEEK